MTRLARRRTTSGCSIARRVICCTTVLRGCSHERSTHAAMDNWSRTSRGLCDSLCAARLACMHMAVRQFGRAAETRNGGVLHVQPPDCDRWPHYVSLSRDRCLLQPWRVVRDLPMAARALGPRTLRSAGIRGAVLSAESPLRNCVAVQKSKAEGTEVTSPKFAQSVQSISAAISWKELS